ncbi:BrxE family protein [Kribbella soli]
MLADSGVTIDRLLTVVRLGDADRLGWWRSHSVDETAEYVLGEAFPSTWMATGVELAMESARVRHEQLLGRPTQIHIFSDYLPFHRLLRNWLIERKIERDPAPLEWLPAASTEDLKARLPLPNGGERRADGLYVGDLRREDLDDDAALSTTLDTLTAAFAGTKQDFLAPYLDLVD